MGAHRTTNKTEQRTAPFYRFSGGNRLSLATRMYAAFLARARARPQATSALDRKSEMEVQAALQRVMMGRTVVAVAHRLVTIRHGDAGPLRRMVLVLNFILFLQAPLILLRFFWHGFGGVRVRI